MAVVQKPEYPVHCFVWIAPIDTGKNCIDSEVAARIAGETAGEQLGRDVRTVLCAGRWDESQGSSFHFLYEQQDSYQQRLKMHYQFQFFCDAHL
jgi:hypothetical protein